MSIEKKLICTLEQFKHSDIMESTAKIQRLTLQEAIFILAYHTRLLLAFFGSIFMPVAQKRNAKICVKMVQSYQLKINISVL